MNYNITLPSKIGYTVYSKRKCKFCDMVKDRLTKEHIQFTTVDCDDYLEEDSVDLFLDTMESVIGKCYSKFPMVFHNGIFIGGYKETCVAIEKNNCITNDDDF